MPDQNYINNRTSHSTIRHSVDIYISRFSDTYGVLKKDMSVKDKSEQSKCLRHLRDRITEIINNNIADGANG
jgi:hypothetical protein